jgi:hypothetical protein
MASPTLANLERQLANARRNQRAGLMAWVMPTAAGRINPRADPRYWQEVNATARVRNLEARIAAKRAQNARRATARRHWGVARRLVTASRAVRRMRENAWRSPVQGGSAYRRLAGRTLVGRPPTRNVGTSTRRSPSGSPSARSRSRGRSPSGSPSSRSRSRSRSPRTGARNLNRDALVVARLFNNASRHEGAGWIEQAYNAQNVLKHKYGNSVAENAVARALTTIKRK